jgi:uncharacterized membrane protein
VEATNCSFHAAQDTVTIAHATLAIINLSKARIDILCRPKPPSARARDARRGGSRSNSRSASGSTRDRSDAPRSAGGYLRGALRGGSVGVGIQRRDVLAVIGGTFKPGDEIETLDEDEILDFAAGTAIG